MLDVLHLSDKGFALFANNLVNCVEDKYPDLQFKSLHPSKGTRGGAGGREFYKSRGKVQDDWDRGRGGRGDWSSS